MKKTIDEYIKTFPAELQPKLQELREFISSLIPNAVEKISYHMPTFTLNGESVVYFAAWTQHVSLYPFSNEMMTDIPEAAQYKTSGKGTIQFPLDKPLPFELIRKIVEYRLRELRQA